MRCVALRWWRSGNQQSPVEEVDAPVVSCLVHAALSEWHLGNMTSSRSSMAEAISLAKKAELIWPALTNALFNSGILAHFERNVLETERLASEVIELSTRHNFPILAGHRIHTPRLGAQRLR